MIIDCSTAATYDDRLVYPRLFKWLVRAIDEARIVARYSKDPSTKCGCVIMSQTFRPVSRGCNGFPQNVADDPAILNDRERKLERILHAEQNALLFAERSVSGCYVATWPIGPCLRCTAMLIQAGVFGVAYPRTTHAGWSRQIAEAATWRSEAGIISYLFPAVPAISDVDSPYDVRYDTHDR